MYKNNSLQRTSLLTLQQIQRYCQTNRQQFDLFDSLLHQKSYPADAQSYAKVEQGEDQRMIPQQHSQHHGCKCSKIGCLKLYCQCFANGKKCGPGCSCSCCHNKQGNQVQIYKAKMLANYRHPGYFQGVPALVPTRKCTCKKSRCHKKYCQCYNAGLKCTELCECKDCYNGHPHSHHQQMNFLLSYEQSMQIQVHA